jgi:hypothetical protein
MKGKQRVCKDTKARWHFVDLHPGDGGMAARLS